MTPLYQPRISAHAIDRFRERIVALPERQVVDLLLTAAVRAALARGARRITVGIVTMIARHGTVVSIYPSDWPTDPQGVNKAKGRRLAPKPEKGGYRRIQAAHRAAEVRARK